MIVNVILSPDGEYHDGFLNPKWNRTKQDIGNNYFDAMKCIALKLSNYSEQNKHVLAVAQILHNSIMIKGEDYTSNFLMIYKLSNNLKAITNETIN